MSPSESTNLTRDGGLTRTDTYFASPELSQRADLLRHLTENSNLIPLVRGVEGMGKTTFIQHLLDLAPENWIPVEICADVMLQPDALLADLADLFDQDDTSDQLMDDLIRHFDGLRQDGFLPVIIVDDAHLLPEASIITLLRLHERGRNDVPLAQILLFAEPEIDDLLKTPQLRVMNLQSLQLLDMPEFTLAQTELYLEHLLSAEESSNIKPLSASQIEKIHYETGGSPGLIKEQAQRLIDSTKKSMTTALSLRDYFSTKSIIGGVLTSVIVMLILIYQNDINSIFSGKKEPGVTIPNERIAADGSVSLPIPDFVDGARQEQEMAEGPLENQDVPGDIEPADGGQSDLGPVAEEMEVRKDEEVTQSRDQAPQLGKANPEPEPESARLQPSEESNQPGKEEKEITKQILEEEKVTQSEEAPPRNEQKEGQAEEVQSNVSKTNVITEPAKEDKPQKIVQKGSDAIKKEPAAQTQRAKKPEKTIEARKEVKPSPVKPVVKTPIPAIKESPKSVEVDQASVEKKGPLAPAPVEERSTMLVEKDSPEVKVTKNPSDRSSDTKLAITTTKKVVATKTTGSSRFFREEWLLKQSPSSYTIQLAGLQDEKGIAEFIRRHSVNGPVAYYRTHRNGKPWFPVLYGAYSTRNRAVEARNNLPESLIKTGPWLRTLGSIQNDIKAR